MIYVSNISKMVDSLNLKFKELTPVIEKASRKIASDLLFTNKDRVYTLGMDATTKGKIGNYSTKPTLIGAKSFKNISSVNKVFGKRSGLKSGIAVVKTYKKNKTQKALQWRTVGGQHLAILPTGYKGIRDIDGDETKFVNLKRTGKMMRDLQFGKVGNLWCVGFPANYNQNLTYSEMVSHFREKYGKKIWGISISDEKLIDSIIKKYIDNAINQKTTK